MVKFIYYLILCITLFLYCCGKHNIKVIFFESILSVVCECELFLVLLEPLVRLFPLGLNLEQQKFNSLILGFNTIRTNIEDDLIRTPAIEPIYIGYSMAFKSFKKTKRIRQCFYHHLQFFDKKEKIHANKKTFDEYITNAINTGKSNNKNGKYDSNL